MEFLVTGIIRSAHGIDGFVKVESASGEFEHFLGLTDLIVRKKNSFEKTFEIENVEIAHNFVLLKLKGIDNPEKAKELSGAELLIPKDKACPLKKGEFYINDLCQCSLVYDGMPLGTIVDVLEGGAGDLLEVSLTESNQKRLVPFRNEFIGKVDIGAKTVELMHRWILE